MCVKVEPTYYRLELDDYSAAAFTSFGKYYYGTLEDLRCFFGELAHDEKLKKQFKELLSTFQAFEEGRQDLSHSIAYRKVPFLVPVQLLHREPVTLENYKWTHINTWDRPYYMRCDEVKSEHLWLACDGEKCYVIRNGRPEMGQITGTGCQLSGMMTAFVAANPDNQLEAAAAAVCMMGLAGEIGWSRMVEGDGNSTYRNRIIDAIYNMDGSTLDKGARFEIR